MEYDGDLEAGEIGDSSDDDGEVRSRARTGDRRSQKSRNMGRGLGRMPSRSRQESTRELVDFFAGRMQEARDAWTARVEALQKRWRASILSGDWGRRDAGLSDRDSALRITFGLMVRLYAYEDALKDLRRAAEQDPSCLEFFAPQVGAMWEPAAK